jgi:hypothetical protein
LLDKRDGATDRLRRAVTQDPLHRLLASRPLWVMRRCFHELPEDVTTFRVIQGNTARLIAGLPEKSQRARRLDRRALTSGRSRRARGVTKYSLGSSSTTRST